MVLSSKWSVSRSCVFNFELWLIWGPGSCTLMKPEPEVLIRWNTWQRDFLHRTRSYRSTCSTHLKVNFNILKSFCPGKMCETFTLHLSQRSHRESSGVFVTPASTFGDQAKQRHSRKVIWTVTRFSLLWDSLNMVSKHNTYIYICIPEPELTYYVYRVYTYMVF